MKLNLDLPADVSIGLRRLAHDLDKDVAAAAVVALRAALEAMGHIDVRALDEDSDVEGNA